MRELQQKFVSVVLLETVGLLYCRIAAADITPQCLGVGSCEALTID